MNYKNTYIDPSISELVEYTLNNKSIKNSDKFETLKNMGTHSKSATAHMWNLLNKTPKNWVKHWILSAVINNHKSYKEEYFIKELKKEFAEKQPGKARFARFK